MILVIPGIASDWVPAKVVDIEGDTVTGEIKAGKKTYSDFIKFRDATGRKYILSPEYYPEVITTEDHYVSIWFDESVSGYNLYCYGKLLVTSDVQVYDVIYPFRTCACKTQGTRKHNWVLKVLDEPLFIVDHNLFTEEIQNEIDLQTFLIGFTDLTEQDLRGLTKREDLLDVLRKYNETFRQENRTYRQDSFDL